MLQKCRKLTTDKLEKFQEVVPAKGRMGQIACSNMSVNWSNGDICTSLCAISFHQLKSC